MALIAIRQPNNLLMLFSTVSCAPIEVNLTRQQFIDAYVECFVGCSYMTADQIINDAVDTVDNFVNPWDRFLDSFIPCYARSEDDISEEFESWIQKCSVSI